MTQQKNKSEKVLKFNGFGFPVLLIGAPVKKILGEDVLDLNFNNLEEQIFLALIKKPGRLSLFLCEFCLRMVIAGRLLN
jgi:hypothetical protein